MPDTYPTGSRLSLLSVSLLGLCAVSLALSVSPLTRLWKLSFTLPMQEREDILHPNPGDDNTLSNSEDKAQDEVVAPELVVVAPERSDADDDIEESYNEGLNEADIEGRLQEEDREYARLDVESDEITAYFRQAGDLMTRFKQAGGLETLQQAIQMFRQILEFTTLDHPLRGSVLNSLAVAVTKHYAQSGGTDKLEEATSLHRAALALHPLGHSERGHSLCSLANVLIWDYERSGMDIKLKEATVSQKSNLPYQPGPGLVGPCRAMSGWSRHARPGKPTPLKMVRMHSEWLKIMLAKSDWA